MHVLVEELAFRFVFVLSERRKKRGREMMNVNVN
jgi:hypothetical protein